MEWNGMEWNGMEWNGKRRKRWEAISPTRVLWELECVCYFFSGGPTQGRSVSKSTYRTIVPVV